MRRTGTAGTRGSAAVLLLVAAALGAGCLAPNDQPMVARQVCDPAVALCDPALLDTPDVEGEADVVDNVTVTDAPVWEVGDWWTFSSSDGRSITLVVVGAGASYEVRPADNETATMEAIGGWSLVGNIGTDLSGEDDAGRVRFFDWPLEEGKTWTLSMSGRSLRATAQLEGKQWRVTATDGEFTVIYTYDPDVRWFTSLRYETFQFGLNLANSGREFSGEVVVANVQPIYRYQTGAAPVGSINLNAGVSGLALRYAYAGAPNFALSLRLTDPTGAVHQFVPDQVCSAECRGRDMVLLPAIPGAWTIASPSAGDGRLAVDLYEVQETRRAVR